MWNLDMYSRLHLADAWVPITPIERLVCMSGGNPREDLIEHKFPRRPRGWSNRRSGTSSALNISKARRPRSFAAAMAERTTWMSRADRSCRAMSSTGSAASAESKFRTTAGLL
jgi:hypothetical protein